MLTDFQKILRIASSSGGEEDLTTIVQIDLAFYGVDSIKLKEGRRGSKGGKPQLGE